jgi:hypothetical protein
MEFGKIKATKSDFPKPYWKNTFGSLKVDPKGIRHL